MDNFIKVYDNAIDEDSCNMLIGKFETYEDQHEVVRQAERDEAISFKQINLVTHREEWKSVAAGAMEMFQDYVLRYIYDCKIKPKQWPTTYGYEAIRIKRYLNNDYDRFDPHVDVMNYETARRFLAFFVYLNDVDEGGETVFLSINRPGTYIPIKIKAETGRLLIFPPTWQYYHTGLKPVSSNKYLMNSYCHYG
jgi:hypothetical protein